jgi:RNA polymerase sigma factor (TIGR02999 family)
MQRREKKSGFHRHKALCGRPVACLYSLTAKHRRDEQSPGAKELQCCKVEPMHPQASGEITALLRAWSLGDEEALKNLIPLVDRELLNIAQRRLEARHRDPILDTTALVNEAYVRLIDSKQSSWHDRAHFFAVCATIMRRILVDHTRARRTAKRGGGAPKISLDEALAVAPELPSDLVAIDEALEALTRNPHDFWELRGSERRG